MKDTKEKKPFPADVQKQQGRKGSPARRINAAFTEANYEYLRQLSDLYDVNMTAIINYAVQQLRDLHPEYLTDGINYHRNRNELHEKEADT